MYEMGPLPFHPFSGTIVASKQQPSAKESSQLTLVVFKDRYYPLADTDFTLMREHKITVGCIPEVTLSVLRRTLLKGVKIVEVRWIEVFYQLLEQFKASFSKHDAEYRFRSEENWIIVSVDSDDKEGVQFAQEQVTVLRKYAGRYGFALRSQVKERDGSTLIRASFIRDPEIVPSHHFRTPDLEDSGLRLNLHLSQSCRLVLENRKSPIGIPTVKALFQDRLGEEWKDGFARAFELHRLSSEDMLSAIGFFSDLLILQQSLKKSK